MEKQFNNLEEVNTMAYETSSENKETASVQSSIEKFLRDEDVVKSLSTAPHVFDNILEKLDRTCHWAIRNGAYERDVIRGIYTLISELSMAYSMKEKLHFTRGDIVKCNFGYHLDGETNGNFVYSIVCDIDNDTAFVIPIIGNTTILKSRDYYLKIDSKKDAVYYDNTVGGYAIPRRGKYVRVERFVSVIGQTKPEFFKKLLDFLPSAFDFTDTQE